MHIPHSKDDQKWMRSALVMASKGDGLTAPNPSVGCVIKRIMVLSVVA